VTHGDETKLEKDGRAYLKWLAEQLSDDLCRVTRVDVLRHSRNRHLLGQFAEATVRQFIVNAVAPLNVSHGSIVHPQNTDRLPQLDAIVWQPCPSPPIYTAQDFALVPRGSALGWLEIKSSDQACAASKLEMQVSHRDLVVRPSGRPPMPASIAETVIQQSIERPALGIVCTLRHGRPIGRELADLVALKKVVVLFEERDDGIWKVNGNGVLTLVAFLQELRLRARIWEWEFVNLGLLDHPRE
jgi:hypothetical protein